MNIEDRPVEAVLSALGRRLRRARLNANLTQSDLGSQAGVALKTVRNAEDGQNISLETLILLLQGVGFAGDLDLLMADRGPSPIEMAARELSRCAIAYRDCICSLSPVARRSKRRVMKCARPFSCSS